MKNGNKLLADILSAHFLNGGSTFSLTSKQNMSGQSGFCLSIFPDREKIIAEVLTKSKLQSYIEKNKDLLDRENVCLGTWTDSVSRKTYIDCIIIAKTKRLALKLAIDHKQNAIFNLKSGDTIYFKGE